MAASPLLFPSPAAARICAGGASIVTLQRAAAVARERIAALPGVRVLGTEPDAAAPADGVRLAVDVRDTGRDGREVACALAGRGIPVEAAAARALVLRLRPQDVAEAMQERLAPALLQALWSAPPARGFEFTLDRLARPANQG